MPTMHSMDVAYARHATTHTLHTHSQADGTHDSDMSVMPPTYTITSHHATRSMYGYIGHVGYALPHAP